MRMRLRPMASADCAAAYRLTQRLHWPHRIDDWQEALRLGEGVVAECDGQITGTALSWRWGEQWATLGLVIVDAAFQGRGLGRRLLEHQMAALSDRRIRLHATAAGLPLYRKLGFAPAGETQQFQTARLAAAAPVDLAAGQRLRRAREDDLPELVELDRQASGLLRPTLAAYLFRHAELWALEKGGRVVGWGASRRFGHGWTLGPVIARGEADAQRLIAQLMQARVGDFVRIDTEAAQKMGGWLSRWGLEQVDSPVVMVRGAPWRAAEGLRTFALMSQAMA